MIKLIATSEGVKAEVKGTAHDIAEDLAHLTAGKVITYDTAREIAEQARRENGKGAGK